MLSLDLRIQWSVSFGQRIQSNRERIASMAGSIKNAESVHQWTICRSLMMDLFFSPVLEVPKVARSKYSNGDFRLQPSKSFPTVDIMSLYTSLKIME